jgi:hypothetical protein
MDIGELITYIFTGHGPGGVIVMIVVGLAAGIYFWLTRWILKGGEEDSDEFRYR